jgi:hypothetical protein
MSSPEGGHLRRPRFFRILTSVFGLTALAACHSPSSPSGNPAGSASSTGVQIVATWDTAADVDLHVVEPSGTEIYWAQPGPTATGGTLDQDANEECHNTLNKETIRWATDAPNGVYIVRLDLYMNCNAPQANYSVVITNGATVLPAIVGTLSGIGDVGAAGSGQLVAQFTHTSGSLTARNNFPRPPGALRFFASLQTVFQHP